ncbi:MAG: DOMON-like domain-containing protein [Myxococcales bacterium]|nr:DOMON-like domain-containing protein [Myxococcales bacterium]MCB9713945.1 DOMON-like domain-containing protein [Myxococcales bacterium]
MTPVRPSPWPEPLVRVALRPHPSASCDAVHGLVVELGLGRPGVLAVGYRLEAEVQRLRIPGPEAGLDPARLWAHTCFELFVAQVQADGYVEHNLSPSGQHATFGFCGYRQRTDDPSPSLELSSCTEPGRLSLRATIALPSWAAAGARLSPTAVIEDAAGGLSYWAVHHPCARPDFHHRDGFGLALSLHPSPAIALTPASAP